MKSVINWGLSLGALALVSADNVELCGKDAVHRTDDFDYRSNAWNPVGDGFQCVSIDDAAPAFDATWQWDADPTDVHSYPHVRFKSQWLPSPMKSIRSMQLKTSWSMTRNFDAANPPRTFSQDSWAEEKQDLEDAGVVANAAWDFFADVNKTRTYNPVDANTEIMIWLTQVGNAQPLKGESILTTMDIGGVEFELNYAKNFRDHDVFTWMPANGASVPEFDADVAPMLEYIRTSGLIDEESWLGLVEFGTETWNSPVNVTFTAAGYSMNLDNGEDPVSGDGPSNNNGGNDDDDNAAAGLKVGSAMLSAAALLGVWAVMN